MPAIKMNPNYNRARFLIADRGWEFEKEMIVACTEWIMDCEWADEDFDVSELTNNQIFVGVQRHYDGGLLGFLNDGTYI